MRRLPSSAHGAVFGVAMAVFYSGLMSGVFTGMSMGWTLETLVAWLRAWALGLAIAAPAGLVLRPLAQMIADALTRSPATEHHRS
jgi:Protein of unknown function (DUF2798)